MKAIKIITHPVLLITSFLFILISGEHWGGFYLLYILLALPHGGIHALFAAAGVLLLTFSYAKYRRARKNIIEPALNITGVVFMVGSIYLFFHLDRQGYNTGTFEQLAPQITLLLFGLLTTGFVIYNLYPLSGNTKSDADLSLKET